LVGCAFFLNLHHRSAAQAEMFRAFDSRPVSCQAVKRCLTPIGGEKCLAQTRPTIPWSFSSCHRVLHRVGQLSSRRSSHFTTLLEKRWKCDALRTRNIV
jgi:hypothetical protein